MNQKKYSPGFLLVLLIAGLSYFLSTLHASFDSLVTSIIIGMFIGNLTGIRNAFEKGAERAVKILLPAGIGLYGTQLVFQGMNAGLLVSILLVFMSLFGFTLLTSYGFNVNRKLAILLASGLSICGASAIAVISPLIGARKEDTSIAIISLMMLGLTGMIFFPLVHDLFSLSNGEFIFLAGTTLPMLGQVKVAAGNVCPECVISALDIKLIRISFLLFLVTVSVAISGKKEKKVTIPWFIVVFFFFASAVNLFDLPKSVMSYAKAASSFLLSAGLAAIGFSVDFNSIIEEGITPLGVITTSWVVTILLIYTIRNLFYV
ncbi:MAG: putative sulfate exporter family transporter [Nitrospirae bacterium]|nr:putative sulfate exporter family transporter [Nitrospirota bacterium]